MENAEQITILIADDDDGHAHLIQRRFKEVGVFNPVIRFRDGDEAWNFVSGRSEPRLEPERHYLLLLDISMPVMDGIEVLTRMKADPCLKSIPIIMLTTTDDPKEIGRCYELGCNVYITKPVDYESFAGAIRQLGLFLSVMQAPDIE